MQGGVVKKMKHLDQVILDNIVRIAPVLSELIEGQIGVTVTSKNKWLAYCHKGEKRVHIRIGDELQGESVSAKCMRANHLIIERMENGFLGPSYIGRAAPLHNSEGEIIGSIGYLKVMESEEEVSNFIIGRNKTMQKAYQQALKAAKADTNILLLGETGTGKDLLAKLIHQNSTRSNQPFLVVNCSAIPKELFESEMFGYERGAFTGATKAGKKGFFELANTGTIFLDEIGDLDLSLQAKLLRVLQTKKILRIGSEKETKTDVRVISATNQDLERRVLTNTFRSDLYFRLASLVIYIPPLRARKEDLPLFIDRFLAEKSSQFGKRSMSISPGAYKMLLEYEYPGNLRELKNIIQRGVIVADDATIRETDLREAFQSERQPKTEADLNKVDRICSLAELERDMIIKALKSFRKKKEVARALGISRDTLYRKLRKYEVDSS
jgi:transcriptional regulator with PAS, ATPase and Fis domain